MIQNELIKVPEIATILRKSKKTIYRHIETEIIPPSLIFRFGTTIRMRRTDLERLIESKRGK